jgi:hypothetical protein
MPICTNVKCYAPLEDHEGDCIISLAEMVEQHMSRCQNCGRLWGEGDMEPIKDISQRVAPGEPTPSGECPYCGALCQLIESEPAPDAGRIQITGWRAFNDDDDSVSVDVFADDDETTPHDLIAEEFDIDFAADDYSSCEEGKKPGFTNFVNSIIDGQILSSHDGRKFMVSIREIS